MSLAYGSAKVSGYAAYEDFYLDSTGGAFSNLDFEFMLITKQSGISPSGGIMGFSRNFDLSTSHPVGPLFYVYLYKSSAITA